MSQEEILEEPNLVFDQQQAVNQDENITSDEDEPMHAVTTSQRLYILAKSVILKGELSSAEMQATVGNNYGKLQFAFNNLNYFENKLSNNKKCLLNPNNKLF